MGINVESVPCGGDNWPKVKFKIPLYLQTILGMVLGVFWALHWDVPQAFGVMAKTFVEVVKNIAVPLIFFAIVDAVSKSEISGRGVRALLWVCFVNSTMAVLIGLTISNQFQHGQYLSLKGAIDPSKVAELMNQSVLGKVIKSPMILAIVLGLFSGLFLRFARHSSLLKGVTEPAMRGAQFSFAVILKVIHFIVLFAPAAVFGAVAKVVSQYGFHFATGLSAYLLVCLVGMLVHVLVVYHGWIKIIAKMALSTFWKEAREPVAYSFGINSSLATVPLTLKALNRLKVSQGSARLSACIGTNFNNDGILLYEVVAVLFMAQAYGIEFTVWQQLWTVLICVAATIGIGGIPEAGIISLSLVMSSAGLPVEGIAILLSVDWIIARCRSIVNVIGDMSVAVAIDHLSLSRRGSLAGTSPSGDKVQSLFKAS